jgi:uncharacterized membrane protein YraQ (UPF0718 family)
VCSFYFNKEEIKWELYINILAIISRSLFGKKFKWWVVNSKNADIEEEFKSIWQESPSQITEDTRIEFRRLKNRIIEHEQSKTSVSRRMTIAASIVIAASLGATITYFISEHRVNRILTDNELFKFLFLMENLMLLTYQMEAK